MRVLHVIDGLGAGGAERSLAELLPALSRRGVVSMVACTYEAPEGVHQEVAGAGYEVAVVGTARLPACLRLRRLIGSWRPDIVHTTLYEGDVLGRLAAAGTPSKVVTSLVSTTYDGVRAADANVSSAKLAAARTVDAITARRLTDYFHAISVAVRDSAVAHLGIPPERVSVVERGRDLGRLGSPSPLRRSTARSALGIPEHAEVVLNIGRQEPAKGHHTLIDAVALLATSRENLTLVQAGRQGKATQSLRAQVLEAGLSERVRFLGHRADIGDLLSAADVFAFPSIYEGLGGSVLEAMAMRVPVVVSDVPALVDVVDGGRAGRVVPVGDAACLAQAIDALLKSREEAAAMAARAQQVFSDRFTLEQSAARMYELYRHVLGERAS